MVDFKVHLKRDDEINIVKIYEIALEIINDEEQRLFIKKISSCVPDFINDARVIVSGGYKYRIVDEDILFTNSAILEKEERIEIIITPKKEKFFQINVLEKDFSYYPTLIFERENFRELSQVRPEFITTTQFKAKTNIIEPRIIKISPKEFYDNINSEFFIDSTDNVVLQIDIKNVADIPIYLKDAKVINGDIIFANTARYSHEGIHIKYVLHSGEEFTLVTILKPIRKATDIHVNISYAPFNQKNNIKFVTSPNIWIIPVEKGKSAIVKDPFEYITKKLDIHSPELKAKMEKAVKFANEVLAFFNVIFPNYTSHGIDHSLRVVEKVRELLSLNIVNLTEYERYLLAQAILFHDIGMSFPGALNYYKERGIINKENTSKAILILQEKRDEIRKLHEKISYEYIMKYYYKMALSKEEAEIVGEIAKLHRGPKTESVQDPLLIADEEVKIGKQNVRLRTLGAIIRFCDEIDMDYRRIMEDAFSILDGALDSENIRHFKTHQKIRDVRINYEKENNTLIIILECSNILDEGELRRIREGLGQLPIKNALKVLNINDLKVKLVIKEQASNEFDVFRGGHLMEVSSTQKITVQKEAQPTSQNIVHTQQNTIESSHTLNIFEKIGFEKNEAKQLLDIFQNVLKLISPEKKKK